MTIYLVVGETGEYSDRSEWYVCAFREQSKAESFKKECEDFAAEHFKSGYYNHPYGCKHDNSPDPQVHIDYTGITYDIVEVELR